jgi:hypothetical protein
MSVKTWGPATACGGARTPHPARGAIRLQLRRPAGRRELGRAGPRSDSTDARVGRWWLRFRDRGRDVPGVPRLGRFGTRRGRAPGDGPALTGRRQGAGVAAYRVRAGAAPSVSGSSGLSRSLIRVVPSLVAAQLWAQLRKRLQQVAVARRRTDIPTAVLLRVVGCGLLILASLPLLPLRSVVARVGSVCVLLLRFPLPDWRRHMDKSPWAPTDALGDSNAALLPLGGHATSLLAGSHPPPEAMRFTRWPTASAARCSSTGATASTATRRSRCARPAMAACVE